MRRIFGFGIVFLLAGAACSEPADVAGTYTVSVTNRENLCDFDNWVENEQNSGIGVVISQDGEDIQADVQGVVGGVLNIWLGSKVFVGNVDGDEISATIYGSNSFTEGNCSYTFNATMTGVVDGDFIQGDIRYIAKTNNNPDCSGLEACYTRQSFNGTRPPR